MRINSVVLSLTAVIVLISCTQDQLIKVNPTNAINLCPIASLATKGNDVTAANITNLIADAFVSGNTDVPYFSNVVFTKQSNGSFASTPPYYWPETESLDFYAYNPKNSTQVSKTDFRTFVVTPDPIPDNQVDFVYANTNGKTASDVYSSSTYGALGVPLNFRHAEAKIVMKVKNTNPTLKFEVTGWKIGFVSKKGTFTYNTRDDICTDIQNSGQLVATDWHISEDDAATADKQYSKSITSEPIDIDASDVDLTELPGEMILIPQVQTGATGYVPTDGVAQNGDLINGSFLGIEIQIMNKRTATIVKSKIWAVWPLDINWTPGKKYTYFVDLGGGGYYETNQEGTDENLDPILANAIIKFVNVTVDEWVPSLPTDVEMKEASE